MLKNLIDKIQEYQSLTRSINKNHAFYGVICVKTLKRRTSVNLVERPNNGFINLDNIVLYGNTGF